ncbi:hypothetical protein Tco_1096423 [Tanacetum coccineum]
METIHVTFDELTEQPAPVHSSSGPAPNLLMPGPISLGLVPNSAPTIPYVPPTNKDLELLFQPMFDEYFETPMGDYQMPPIPATLTPAIPTGPSVSISFDRDAPSGILSKVEPKNFKSVVTEDCWFQAMQDEIHEFDRLDVWELVPPPESKDIVKKDGLDFVRFLRPVPALKSLCEPTKASLKTRSSPSCLPSEGKLFRVLKQAPWAWVVRHSKKPHLGSAQFLDDKLVTMADVNVNAPEVPSAADALPTHSDEQILPRDKWVPVGKSNYFLDVERTQTNPIFKIAVDILKNTNFFRAFTASSTIPSIYIQQFWNTIRFDKDKGYSYQLDEHRFYLTKTTLRDALQLPTDNDNFTPPPNMNTIISFVNDLGYPNAVRNIFGIVTNDMYPPWRILWGIINRADIDYAERIWEEFTQCIHSFIEDKINLTIHAEGKKKVNPFVIPGYLEFSFKNTKRVRFRMTIPNTLITEDIHTASYYPEYVAKVAKYQWFLTGEETTKSTSSQPPKPKPAPAKPQEKKRKLVLDATEAPSQAKRSKVGRVSKKRTLRLRDEFIDEGVPTTEPRVDDEEAIVQKVLEESMKDAYPAHRGPLPPVVFREPDFGKLQSLLETPKKRNPVEQFIFQRRTPATSEPSGLVESLSLYAELGLTNSGTESDEEVSPEMNVQVQEEGQGGTNPVDAGMSQTPSSHVVHAGPNLDHIDSGIAEASSQPNTEQMDDEFTATAYLKDTSSVPLMTTLVIDITNPQSDSTTVPASMPTTTTIVPPPLPQPQQDVSTSILTQTIGQLEQNIADLVDANQALEERLDKQGNRIHRLETQDLSRLIREQTVEFIDSQEIDQKIEESMKEVVTASNYDKGHEDHKMAYVALQKSIIRDESEKLDADKAQERTKKKSKQDSPKTLPGSPPSPPPPPSPSSASGASGTTEASDSAQDPPPPPSS